MSCTCPPPAIYMMSPEDMAGAFRQAARCSVHGETTERKRWFQVGDMLTNEEAASYLGANVGGGWFTSPAGQEVYVCDGSHKCGKRGFKVLQIGGLR